MPIEINGKGNMLVITGDMSSTSPREIPIDSDIGKSVIDELISDSGKTREEIIGILEDGPIEP